MHYQVSPHTQAKVVTCVAGKVCDVIADLRPSSPTYLKWDAIELEEASGLSVYVPRGCAHGFMALRDQSTIAYLIEGTYCPEAGRIFRWDDPALNIQWPMSDPILSHADQTAPYHSP
jgi:dTDP-4-dehydrorhamnose 3,5-epimerase